MPLRSRLLVVRRLYDIRRNLMLRSCRRPEMRGDVRGEDNVCMPRMHGTATWNVVWSQFFWVPMESRAYWLQVLHSSRS